MWGFGSSGLLGLSTVIQGQDGWQPAKVSLEWQNHNYNHIIYREICGKYSYIWLKLKTNDENLQYHFYQCVYMYFLRSEHYYDTEAEAHEEPDVILHSYIFYSLNFRFRLASRNLYYFPPSWIESDSKSIRVYLQKQHLSSSSIISLRASLGKSQGIYTFSIYSTPISLVPPCASPYICTSVSYRTFLADSFSVSSLSI